MIDRHFEVLTQHGLDAEGEDAYQAPQVVMDHVEYFNSQQGRIAEAIHIVIKEIRRLNDEKSSKIELGALAVVERQKDILVESTSNLYCPKEGILYTPLDMILGSIYIGYEAMLTLKKTGKSSLMQDKLPAQIQFQRLGLPHSSLTEDLGAYATAQVFLQATKSLASHETNPFHNVLLTPIEQLKTLYSMLRNIRDKNPHSEGGHYLRWAYWGYGVTLVGNNAEVHTC